MLILALDTSTDPPGAALLADGRTLAARRFPAGVPLEAGISGLLDGLFEEAGRSRGEVGLVAVGLGPGSYTALRIGVAAAKGVALALGVPAAGVLSTDAIALLAARPGDTEVAVVTDARRGEIGLTRYRAAGGRVERTEGPRLARPEEVLAGRPGPVVVVGDAATLYPTAWTWATRVVPPPYPDLAAAVGRLAALAQADDPLTLAPVYLRGAVALAGKR